MHKFIEGHERDIINIKESETQIALFLSLVLCVMLYLIGFYNDISEYADLLQNIMICLIGGFIGMTGFSLAGMTMMVSLFNKKQIELIEKNNGSGVVEQIMRSYAYLAFISGINTFVLVITSILISCDKKQLPLVLLIIFTFVVSYLSFFDIFYAVALVYNCISLFEISKLYNEDVRERSIENMANSIKTDYILGVLIKKWHITREEAFNGFRDEMAEMPEDIRKEIMDYFEKHYTE